MTFGTRLALYIGILAGIACPAVAQEVSRNQVTTYDQAFFATSQPSNAYEMVRLLPGFVLAEGDSDVRGYSGATGNVLIDGQRPVGKTESLERILTRIPAARVAMIRVIQAGSTNSDMQGYAMLADVVLEKAGSASGRVEAGEAIYRHGFQAPNLTVEATFERDDRVLELLGAVSHEIDDEHGFGSRNRFGGDGTPLRLADYFQPEGADIVQAKLTYRQPFAGGLIRLNGVFLNKRKFADIGYAIYFPRAEFSEGSERKQERIYEGGLYFERPLGPADQLDILSSYRSDTTVAIDRELADSSNSQSDERSVASEAIVRAVLRHRAAFGTIELGAEGAINILDSRNGLLENGLSVPIPQANVRVAERRAELFTTASGPIDSRTTLELGLRYETSRIAQTSDSELAKSISFLKPRFRVSWEPTPSQTLRVLLEREAGQLDFSDFVGAVSLSSGTISAGNTRRGFFHDSGISTDSSWQRTLSVQTAPRFERFVSPWYLSWPIARSRAAIRMA